MKILIITHVIFPFQSPRSFRSTELAKELGIRGHEVTVYANNGNYNYDEFEKKFNVKIKNFGKLKFIKKSSSTKEHYSLLEKVAIKLFRRFLFYPNIEYLYKIKRVLKDESGFDLVISIGAPHSIHWGVAWALKENKALAARWIADCGDPFMGNKFESPPSYFSFLERWFCERADFITVPIENARSAYYPEFHSKIRVVPQGFNFSDIKISQKSVKNKVPTFAYAGMVYKGKRDPRALLTYLSSLAVDFRFIVYSNDAVLFSSFSNVLGNKMEIRQYIPRKELIFELSCMDFLVNIENVMEEQSPSKLIDYALSGRPILSVSSFNIETENINKFISGDYSNSKVIDIDKFDIKKVADQFIQLS